MLPALALWLGLALPVLSSTLDDGGLESQFQLGLISLQQGQYETASRIFYDLSLKSPQPRIKLELARSLYLSGRFQAAREVFEAILTLHHPPWTVQKHIDFYLDEIDLQLGFTHFDIALISDSNPGNLTSSNKIRIGGQILNLVEPAGSRNLLGANYRLSGGKALSGKRAVGHFLIDYADFERSRFDRLWLELGVDLRHRALDSFRLTPQLAGYWLDGRPQYHQWTTALRYYPDRTREYSQSHQLQLGQIDFSEADYLDANKLSWHSLFQRPSGPHLLFDYGLSLDLNQARETPYSYRRINVMIGTDFNLQGMRWRLAARFGKRVFGATDPLFGNRRDDREQQLSLRLRPQGLRFFGRQLEIELSHQRTASTLEFFSYDKTLLSLALTESR